MTTDTTDTKLAMKRPHNWAAWAIGRQTRNGFHVRRIVWGQLLAWHELREGEQIRAATIQVERRFKWRRNLAKEESP